MSARKRTLIGSMLACRCPQCREGRLFLNPSAYSLKDIGKNHLVCPVCGTNLQPEPGFYFGAAYVSWALTVGLWVSVFVALKVFNAIGLIEYSFLTHPGTFLWTGLITSIVLFPYMFRVSRSIWAHFFIKPKEENQDSDSALSHEVSQS